MSVLLITGFLEQNNDFCHTIAELFDRLFSCVGVDQEKEHTKSPQPH